MDNELQMRFNPRTTMCFSMMRRGSIPVRELYTVLALRVFDDTRRSRELGSARLIDGIEYPVIMVSNREQELASRVIVARQFDAPDFADGRAFICVWRWERGLQLPIRVVDIAKFVRHEARSLVPYQVITASEELMAMGYWEVEKWQ